MTWRAGFVWGMALVACLAIGGCPWPPSDGTTPPPADTTGTVSGTVTNSYTDAGVAGVTITLDPAVAGVSIVTDADGKYSQDLPPGVYTMTFAASKYTTQTKAFAVNKDNVEIDVALTPTQRVFVTASVSGDAEPGAALTATVNVEIMDGATTVTGYAWEQSNSVPVTLANADTATATVTLPALDVYKDELLAILREPPITEAQLPPNVPIPVNEEGEFPAGLLERFYVVGLNPFSLEEATIVTVEVSVTTSAGTFTDDVEIHAAVPFKPNPGLQNVPTGIAVLLHGKTQDTYDWALARPTGSSATLADATTQNPYFTPDVEGKYTITVTDNTVDPAEVVTLDIYAGEWVGAITGQDANGRPRATNCTICHNGNLAPDMFTDWAQSGHAEIFTDSLNSSTHYSTSCLPCHTVGYDPDVANNGFDDARDYDDFLDLFTTDGSHFHADPTNWATALRETRDTAKLGNIQCENCHGPNSTDLHFNDEFDRERISLSSDVCGVCHGEPLRHGRFQQWQLSAHANYELAIDESGSGDCSRCHTANGFLAWLPVLLGEVDGNPAANVQVTWTADEAHPQTCVVCHDPHSVGTTTGIATDATVRISGNTPALIGGFSVIGAGNGAICMTCHNSRRGLRNDSNFNPDDATRAPHGSAQTDVLMGQNAYLVNVGLRGSHSLIEDTCVNCHMTQTPPPAALSYNLGGTNHTFYAAPDICAKCHTEIPTATLLTEAVDGAMEELKALMEEAILAVMAEQIDAGNKIAIGNLATITDIAQIASIELTESRGRQAIATVLADDTELAATSLANVRVLDEGDNDLGQLYDFADERLGKAGWNYALAHNDGSHGVHNPSFVLEFLDAAITALNEILSD